MIFPILVLILVGVIAYFHYVEGLFSATISAFCAILAAVLAFSYHETIIFTLLKGKVANYAHAMVLVALFALGYLILRVIFDKAIPGNVRFPLYVDRVGGAVMGIIAGVFATGILAIAAASLPFDQASPYARFPLAEDVDVTVSSGGGSQAQDAKVRAALDEPEPGRLNANAEAGSGMILPVDDIVVNLVSKLSTGALAGTQPLEAVHPSYLDELFASRLGIQTGASRVAINTDEIKQFNVGGAYTIEQIAQADSELGSVRNNKLPKGAETPQRRPAPNEVLLIVRGQFTRGAHDKDNNVRFSPASVRLVAGGNNHIPIGTIDSAGVLRVNLPDDFLVAPGDANIDFVFQVPREDLGLQPAPTRARGAASEAEAAPKLADGVFIEAKRMGVVDLSGKSIDAYPGPLEATVHQKRGAPAPKAPGVAGPTGPAGGTVAAGAPAADAASSPIVFGKADVSAKLFTPVNVAGEGDGEKTFPSGSANLRDGKIAKLDVNMTQTVELLSRGDYARDELYVPPGMKMVQIVGTAPPKAPPEPWDWADKLGQFELVDAGGTKYKPNGAWAKVKGAQGSNRMVARYEAESQVTDVSHEEGRPTEVWIAFLVPEGTQLAELQFDGKRVAAVDQKVD